ncbi:hypothetical protein JTB14_024113 [Gonioctena quinquepunctata]|nr:hypothetical protein JTB14_024113 [Gonioctena quinquepunctata]
MLIYNNYSVIFFNPKGPLSRKDDYFEEASNYLSIIRISSHKSGDGLGLDSKGFWCPFLNILAGSKKSSETGDAGGVNVSMMPSILCICSSILRIIVESESSCCLAMEDPRLNW